jgi:WD40 repeat protein
MKRLLSVLIGVCACLLGLVRAQDVAFSTRYEAVAKLAYGDGGRVVVTLSVDAGNDLTRVELWDGASYAPLGDIGDMAGLAVRDIAIHPTAPRLITTDASGGVAFWDTDTRQALVQTKGHDGQAFVTYSPNGAYAVTIDTNGLIVWDGNTFEPLVIYPLQREADDFVQPVTINPESQMAGWLSGQNVLTVLDLTQGTPLLTTTLNAETTLFGLVWAFGTQVALVNNGILEVWDLATQEPTARFTTQADALAFAFAPQNKRLALASIAGEVSLWNVATQSLERVLLPFGSVVYALALAPDEGTLLVAGEGGRVLAFTLP